LIIIAIYLSYVYVLFEIEKCQKKKKFSHFTDSIGGEEEECFGVIGEK